MAKLGKRTRGAREAFAGKSNLTVEEAVALVKTNATAKFDETIEFLLFFFSNSSQTIPVILDLPKGTTT